MGVSLIYGLVWFSIIAFCIARCRTGMTTAASLVGLWLLFTLAVPATLATLSEAAYPTPSRLALLSEIREAQGETHRQLDALTEGFLLDHPDLTVGDDSVPAYVRAAFLSNEAGRAATRGVVEDFAAARAGREQTIRWAQYLSPSIIAQRLLMQTAGADLRRQLNYQSQVAAALAGLADSVGPAVVSRNRLSVAEFDRLEPFVFKDATARQIAVSAVGPSLFLLLLSLVIGVAAHRRLLASSPVE